LDKSKQSKDKSGDDDEDGKKDKEKDGKDGKKSGSSKKSGSEDGDEDQLGDMGSGKKTPAKSDAKSGPPPSPSSKSSTPAAKTSSASSSSASSSSKSSSISSSNKSPKSESGVDEFGDDGSKEPSKPSTRGSMDFKRVDSTRNASKSDKPTKKDSILGGKDGTVTISAGGGAESGKFDAQAEKNKSKAFEMLKKGYIFQKFKHKSPKTRMIWVSDNMARLIWGDEKKKTEKGDIKVKDILNITAGCQGTKKPALAFTINTTGRALELEADTNETKEAWISALKLLTGRYL